MSEPVEPSSSSPEEAVRPRTARPIVARGGVEYRLKRLLLVLLLGGCGIAFAYDGTTRWPRQNADARRQGHTPPHSDLDLLLQKVLAAVLLPGSIAVLIVAARASRGQFVLDESDVLHVPGHPPVPLSAVTAVDRRRWDRKGIALVDYQLPDGTAGRFTLDDFIYQRQPIDDIFDQVMAAVAAPATDAPLIQAGSEGTPEDPGQPAG